MLPKEGPLNDLQTQIKKENLKQASFKMTDYFVQKVRKDENGNIIKVKTRFNEFSTLKVVEMLESKQHRFFVEKGRISIGVYPRGGRKYLRSYKDGYWDNNLDNLPLF